MAKSLAKSAWLYRRTFSGSKVVLRALVEARDALRVDDAKAALRIIEDTLRDD